MRLKTKPTTIAAGVAVAVFALVVINGNRGPAVYSGHNIAIALVVGISLGGIYAISAGGLVVTYSTTGIFNFAHGAIGCFLAFVYWELRVNRNWPTPLALIAVIFVLAPLLGIGLDVFLMRRLRNAPLVVQLMVTVGLMLTFMGITLTMWKPTQGRALQHFFESSKGVEVGNVIATWHRIITVAVALGIALLLRTLLYRTRIGISMRAVVDNRNLAGLTGARPSVISGASWALGCMTAAVAGILIAPETGLVVENLTLVIVVAFAAAAIGQLKSLPWAFAGGMIIGLVTGFTRVFIAFGPNYSYASEAIPAVILFIAVLFLPQARLATGSLRLTKRTERLTTPGEALGAAALIFGLVAAWANGWIPWITGTTFGQRTEVWLGRGVGFLVIGLIMLSLVPLIGWAGQVSFANFAIAGFGAAMYAHVGGQHGNPLALLWVMLICAPLGALVALPALRLKGLYLALATMAFAEFSDKILFRHPRIIDPVKNGRLYEPLRVLGFRISSDGPDRKAFVIFLALAFVVLFLLLEALRRSRWARRWIAMADSPAASATIGVNLTTAKIAVFALSGAMAGFAGCMLGLQQGSLRGDSFPLFAGLPLVLLLAVQGVRYPVAAFMGVVGLAAFPALYEVAGQPNYLTSIALIGPGLAAIAMAYRPEGAVFYAGRDLAALLPWRRDAREEKALAVAKLRSQDVTRDEINDLGIDRPFTVEKIAQLDRALNVADELLERPGVGAPPAEEVPDGTLVS
ncbi:MAG: branched-chain amino acid ABC-type transport system, permease component [Acidimicrobiales bacterium]|nr:branched-chain amino acid ABC-type transport system, permease component [Acidimicrobiales bacterium]